MCKLWTQSTEQLQSHDLLDSHPCYGPLVSQSEQRPCDVISTFQYLSYHFMHSDMLVFTILFEVLQLIYQTLHGDKLARQKHKTA